MGWFVPLPPGTAITHTNSLLPPPLTTASKTPPSRFQRRKGSIYSTPASRDGHVDRNYAEKYHDKLVEKGWAKK